MIRENSEYLVIQGRVNSIALHKLNLKTIGKPNQIWLFIDYSPQKIQKGKKFNLLLEGEQKQLIHPGQYSAKLLNIYDQFGNELINIPNGYRAICKFDFSPNIPNFIRNLPLTGNWKFNKKSITLANASDIYFSIEDKVFDSFIKVAIDSFLTYNSKNQLLTKIPRVKFYKIIQTKYKLDHDQANNFLAVLIQKGKVKSVDNEIQLLDKAS